LGRGFSFISEQIQKRLSTRANLFKMIYVDEPKPCGIKRVPNVGRRSWADDRTVL
jgi:hypothetical protein